MRTKSLGLALALLPLLGCGSAAPRTVDIDTLLAGKPTSREALEGVWAQIVETASLVPVPIMGDQSGGGRSTRLVHRTWNESAQRFDEAFTRCTNAIYEVQGARTIVPDGTLAKIAPAKYQIEVDPDSGAMSSGPIADLWGVRNLPDPLTTPLPTKDNYRRSPQSDWVWDEDGDGKPGVTIYMRGTIGADLNVIKRTVYTFEGRVVADGHIEGLVHNTLMESNALEATVDWMKGEGKSKPDPDPLKSWFDMVRLDPSAGCGEVAAALQSGRLASSRPF